MRFKAHVFVSGRVQGVFFRLETADEAKRNNVAGWVRNLADGRVEAVFEGEKDDVNKLIKFCSKGPPGAKVTKIEVHREKSKEKSLGFVIQ